MEKRQEQSNPASCLNKASADELLFVLLERDKAAIPAIREWAAQRVMMGLNGPGDEQIVEALAWCEKANPELAKEYADREPADILRESGDVLPTRIGYWANKVAQTIDSELWQMLNDFDLRRSGIPSRAESLRLTIAKLVQVAINKSLDDYDRIPLRTLLDAVEDSAARNESVS